MGADVGSPGTMLAARECGMHEEWRESAQLLLTQWDEDSDLWTQRLYGKVQTILGPAHGLAGNAHALRGYVDDELLSALGVALYLRSCICADPAVPTIDAW